MGYELIFIKKKKISAIDFKAFLNPNIKFNEEELHLSEKFKVHVQNELKLAGLKFKPYLVADSDEIELHFSSYNVCLGYSDISITVPYFKDNLSTKIESEIFKIIELFNSLGLTGYNTQTETLLTDDYKFKSEFSNTKVSLSYFYNSYTAFIEDRKSKKTKRLKLIYSFTIACLAIFGFYKLILLSI